MPYRQKIRGGERRLAKTPLVALPRARQPDLTKQLQAEASRACLK